VEAGKLTDEQFNKLEADAMAEAEDAVQFALSSPEPDPATLLDYIYC